MNDQTLLHRQINPSWIQNGKVTSQAFRPTPKDDGNLSVYDGDLTTAQQAWRHFTLTQKLKSAGVQSVSVEECKALDLEPRSDPITFPEHALIPFGDIQRKEAESFGKRLRSYASERGWQFRADLENG